MQPRLSKRARAIPRLARHWPSLHLRLTACQRCESIDASVGPTELHSAPYRSEVSGRNNSQKTTTQQTMKIGLFFETDSAPASMVRHLGDYGSPRGTPEMVEAVYCAILLVVVCMMLGIIEIPQPHQPDRLSPEPFERERARDRVLSAERQSGEITRLRRQFSSRLI
jgi:hypothetical protein